MNGESPFRNLCEDSRLQTVILTCSLRRLHLQNGLTVRNLAALSNVKLDNAASTVQLAASFKGTFS